MNETSTHIEKINAYNTNKNEKIDFLSKTLFAHWQQHAEYGHYLLEKKPDHYHDIAQDLIMSLEKNKDHHKLYIITNEIQQEIGYILLKNYADYLIDDPILGHRMTLGHVPNLEASYRTIKKGTCTTAIKHVLHDVLSKGNTIQAIMGHHAVDNKSSGSVFHANGFSVVKYHKKYVYLPNIDQYTDTILWKLDRESYMQDLAQYNGDLKQYLRNNRLRICELQGGKHKNLERRYMDMQMKRKKNTIIDKKSI